MKLIYLFYFLYTISFIISIENDFGNVFYLSETDFDNIISEHKAVALVFYTKNCKNCKDFLKEFSEVSKLFKENDLELLFAQTDIGIEKSIKQKFSIETIPTMKLIIDDDIIEYNGLKTKEKIFEWLKMKVLASSKEISQLEELNKIIETSNKMIAIYFGDIFGYSFSIYEKIMKKYDNFVFLHIHNKNKELKTIFQSDNNENIFILKNQGDDKISCDCQITEKNLNDFLLENTFEEILPIDADFIQILHDSNKFALIFFFDTEISYKKEFSEFKNAVTKLKGKQIIFAKSEIKQDVGKRIAEMIGIFKENLPCVFLLKLEKNQLIKYKLENEITVDNINNFYEDLLNNKLSPFVKKEPIPINKLERVLDNFEEIVINSKENIFVFFYAYWSKKSLEFSIHYERLAAYYEDIDDILFTKIDASKNDIPEKYQKYLDGYPTILLFTKDNKDKPNVFNKERTFSSLHNFLKFNVPGLTKVRIHDEL